MESRIGRRITQVWAGFLTAKADALWMQSLFQTMVQFARSPPCKQLLCGPVVAVKGLCFRYQTGTWMGKNTACVSQPAWSVLLRMNQIAIEKPTKGFIGEKKELADNTTYAVSQIQGYIVVGVSSWVWTPLLDFRFLDAPHPIRKRNTSCRQVFSDTHYSHLVQRQ